MPKNRPHTKSLSRLVESVAGGLKKWVEGWRRGGEGVEAMRPGQAFCSLCFTQYKVIIWFYLQPDKCCENAINANAEGFTSVFPVSAFSQFSTDFKHTTPHADHKGQHLNYKQNTEYQLKFIYLSACFASRNAGMSGKMCGMFRENVVMPTAKGKLAKQRRKAPSSIYILVPFYGNIYYDLLYENIFNISSHF